MPNVIYNEIPIKWYRGDEHWPKEKQVKTSILETNRHLDITKEKILNGEYFVKVENKNFDTHEPIITPQWEVESVERYYWLSGRYSKTYREVTFWIDKVNCQRKETTREVHISDGEEYKLPVWAQSCLYKKSMNYDRQIKPKMEDYIHIIAALFGLMAGICLATIWAVKKTLEATAKMVLSQMRHNEATVDEMKRFILLDLIYQFEDREDYKNAAHAKKILDELEKKEYA